MRLVSLRMRGSVARNYIFGLIWRCYGLKWDIWTIGEQSYMVYYTIISYRKIKVYMVETMDMRRSHWSNDVSGTDIISISNMVIIVQDKIIW